MNKPNAKKKKRKYGSDTIKIFNFSFIFIDTKFPRSSDPFYIPSNLLYIMGDHFLDIY